MRRTRTIGPLARRTTELRFDVPAALVIGTVTLAVSAAVFGVTAVVDDFLVGFTVFGGALWWLLRAAHRRMETAEAAPTQARRLAPSRIVRRALILWAVTLSSMALAIPALQDGAGALAGFLVAGGLAFIVDRRWIERREADTGQLIHREARVRWNQRFYTTTR